MMNKLVLRSVCCVMILSTLLGLSACARKEPEKEEKTPDDIFWEKFFSGRTATEDPDNTEKLLHAQNPYGYWGDLIPYYNQEEQRLYMYYMIMKYEYPYDGCTLHLSVSDDMFNFREDPYVVYDYINAAVNQDFRGLGIGIWDIFDLESFPDGPRDWYYFFDPQVNRWRYVALAYLHKGPNRCALVTAVSDDETGLEWHQKATVLQYFPNLKEPECPCAMYIGDRWYIFCSLSGYSIHNVGRPRYYIGEAGKRIDEQDWTAKEAHYIDGEDVCASQIIDVGGHYLLYGWIPKCKDGEYFDGTNDFALWGGVMTFPREIYQREDGTLGTRIPKVLKKMLKKELLTSADGLRIDGETVTVCEQDAGSSCVSFQADVGDSEDFTVSLISAGKSYDLRFVRNDETTTISLGCKSDTGHPVYASYVTDERLTSLDVLILTEGTVTEVFINDTYSLTARTSMFSGSFEKVFASSDGKAEIKSFDLYRLANSENIYD